MFSLPECITWLAVGLMLSVAMVTLNLITVIVFIKNRNLRKRRTYLVINLAVVDLIIAVNFPITNNRGGHGFESR